MVSVNVNTAASGTLASLFSPAKQNEGLGRRAASLHFSALRLLVADFFFFPLLGHSSLVFFLTNSSVASD